MSPSFTREPKTISRKTIVEDASELWKVHQFDELSILGYSKPDLERALRDLEDAEWCLDTLRVYLAPEHTLNIGKMADPSHDPEGEITPALLKAHMFERLTDKRLFREALDRVRKGQQTPQQSPFSPPQRPKPDGS